MHPTNPLTRTRRLVARARWRVVASLAVLAVAAAGLAAAPPAQADPPSVGQRCTGLRDLRLPDTTVAAATVNTSGTFTVPPDQGGTGELPPGSVIRDLPAYCAVELVRTNPPEHDRIHIQVWLPLHAWKHRFEGVGGGGYVAGISFRSLGTALRAGYATASTDTGHPAAQDDGSFALTAGGHVAWPQVTDFADRAVHEMTTAGKQVTARFYANAAGFSYFQGCSMGGRQALAEAQRYPTDYDGIVAAAPAVDFARLSPAQLWPQFAMLRAHDFLPLCKQMAYQRAVTARCDGLDGVVDGVIGNVAACRVDPRRLVGTATPCGIITGRDAEVMAQIWQGPRADGRFLWYGLPTGSDTHYLGMSPWPISTSWFRYWVTGDPRFDWRSLTTQRYVELFQRGVTRFGMLSNDDPDLTAFRDAGGKLLMWTGQADPIIPPQGGIHYYDTVVRRMGGPDRTGRFARLFLAPGVGHCGSVGTVGPVPADPLGALTTWVENGSAPDRILAARADPATGRVTQTRPLCRYPLVARYRGQGDPDDAASFTCARSFAGAGQDRRG